MESPVELPIEQVGTSVEKEPERYEWDDARAEQLVHAIVASLRSHASGSERFEARGNGRLPHELLRRVSRYVNDNLASKLGWEEMAATVGLDTFKFGRKFKQSTGMTPHRYVTRCRMRRAMKLLARGELSLAEIALEIGCTCQSHFTSLFRKHIGTTPGVFRRAATEGRRLLHAASIRESAKRWPLRTPQRALHAARQ